jgi:hypothetical protein
MPHNCQISTVTHKGRLPQLGNRGAALHLADLKLS